MIEVLFITEPNCVQCAKAIKVIEKVQPDFPEMEVSYDDVTVHPEILGKYRVMAAPVIVINGNLESSGGLDESTFRTRLAELRGGAPRR
ncbi:thioredoxin family protein [Aromatoleum toluclasticum]|uniref:thioredoxin family protein n=1 Tax=Aromatoleum toluclasticum TaxID=92003 RepID=UPI001D18F224|nr:thioredoxin family protein [Aromatoleum toluclasticum]MCC4114920.1 thioredoxin family protein [Aromatoleum toluclasticum]